MKAPPRAIPLTTRCVISASVPEDTPVIVTEEAVRATKSPVVKVLVPPVILVTPKSVANPVVKVPVAA